MPLFHVLCDRESRRKHVQLIKDRRVFDAQIAVMEDKCNGMMVAKFGRTVDMERLEAVTVNRWVQNPKARKK